MSELDRLRGIARIMDDAIKIPGTNIRIGLDALLGLIPGVGDVAGGATTAYTLLAAHRLGAPKPVLIRMLFNLLVDTIVGSIPVLGDLFDIGYRANRRNVQLVERFTAMPQATERSSTAFVAVLLIALVGIVAAGLAGAFLIARALWNAVF